MTNLYQNFGTKSNHSIFELNHGNHQRSSRTSRKKLLPFRNYENKLEYNDKLNEFINKIDHDLMNKQPQYESSQQSLGYQNPLNLDKHKSLPSLYSDLAKQATAKIKEINKKKMQALLNLKTNDLTKEDHKMQLQESKKSYKQYSKLNASRPLILRSLIDSNQALSDNKVNKDLRNSSCNGLFITAKSIQFNEANNLSKDLNQRKMILAKSNYDYFDFNKYKAQFHEDEASPTKVYKKIWFANDIDTASYKNNFNASNDNLLF